MIKPYGDMKVENRRVVQPGCVYPLKQAKGSTRIRVTCVTANPKIIQSPTSVRLPRKLLTGTVPEKPEDLSDNPNSVITLTDSKNCKGHFIKLSVSSDGHFEFSQQRRAEIPFHPIRKDLTSLASVSGGYGHPPKRKAIRPGRSGFRQPHRHHRRPTPRL